MAIEYDRHNASSAANSYYERPATIGSLGEVRDRRVLELGCGTGPFTQWLVDHGATVVACDVSAAMLEIARSRVEGAELHHHDLAEPLTFLEDASIDLVGHHWYFTICATGWRRSVSFTGCSVRRAA